MVGGNEEKEIIAGKRRRPKDHKRWNVHLHLRDRERGGEGAGDRRGLSPFLHPTLRALLLDRVTSDEPNIRASAPTTGLPGPAVPAKGWIPSEYTDERVRSSGSLCRHVPPSLIHFNYKGLVFLQGKAVLCDPL